MYKLTLETKISPPDRGTQSVTKLIGVGHSIGAAIRHPGQRLGHKSSVESELAQLVLAFLRLVLRAKFGGCPPMMTRLYTVALQTSAEGARTTNHTVDEAWCASLTIGRSVSGDPCCGSELGDALDGGVGEAGRHPALPRPSQHPAHRALHRTRIRPLQEFLALTPPTLTKQPW